MSLHTITSPTMLLSFMLSVLTSSILSFIPKHNKQNIKADPEKTIKKIAATNNMAPHAFFGVLHNVAVL